jgi:CRISPR/Cas system-associated exonuclease Cas4 (RecB family)
LTGQEIGIWWRNYLEGGPPGLPPLRYPEIALTAPFGSYRLAARYDLIAVKPGRRAVIVDWKTSRRRPSTEQLRNRMQTRVYPYLLARAGTELNGGELFQPEQIEMVYWFAKFPARPVRFLYDDNHYHQDERDLDSLIHEIVRGDFPLTADLHHCRFCPYRSLCDRGVKAGAIKEDIQDQEVWEPEPSIELTLDLDQIAEIEF